MSIKKESNIRLAEEISCLETQYALRTADIEFMRKTLEAQHANMCEKQLANGVLRNKIHALKQKLKRQQMSWTKEERVTLVNEYLNNKPPYLGEFSLETGTGSLLFKPEDGRRSYSVSHPDKIWKHVDSKDLPFLKQLRDFIREEKDVNSAEFNQFLENIKKEEYDNA